MSERDLIHKEPAPIDPEKLRNANPMGSATFDQLRNVYATTEVRTLELERLQRIEAAARKVILHAFAKHSELEMWDAIHELRKALETP